MPKMRRSLRFVSATVPLRPPFEGLVKLRGDVCQKGHRIIQDGLKSGDVRLDQLAGWFAFQCTAPSHTAPCRRAFSKPIPLTTPQIASIVSAVAPKLRKRQSWEKDLDSLFESVARRSFPPEPFELPRGLGWVRDLKAFVKESPLAVERLEVELRSPIGARLYTEIALAGVIRVPKHIQVDSIYDVEAFESATKLQRYAQGQFSRIGVSECRAGRMIQAEVFAALRPFLPDELILTVLACL